VHEGKEPLNDPLNMANGNSKVEYEELKSTSLAVHEIKKQTTFVTKKETDSHKCPFCDKLFQSNNSLVFHI
jgi:hypothetical protein